MRLFEGRSLVTVTILTAGPPMLNIFELLTVVFITFLHYYLLKFFKTVWIYLTSLLKSLVLFITVTK